PCPAPILPGENGRGRRDVWWTLHACPPRARTAHCGLYRVLPRHRYRAARTDAAQIAGRTVYSSACTWSPLIAAVSETGSEAVLRTCPAADSSVLRIDGSIITTRRRGPALDVLDGYSAPAVGSLSSAVCLPRPLPPICIHWRRAVQY